RNNAIYDTSCATRSARDSLTFDERGVLRVIVQPPYPAFNVGIERIAIVNEPGVLTVYADQVHATSRGELGNDPIAARVSIRHNQMISGVPPEPVIIVCRNQVAPLCGEVNVIRPRDCRNVIDRRGSGCEQLLIEAILVAKQGRYRLFTIAKSGIAHHATAKVYARGPGEEVV